MNTPVAVRGRYHGLGQIMRFNWPMYAAAAVATALGVGLLAGAALTPWARVLISALLGAVLFGSLASMVVSHWIYDRSVLMRWTWLTELFEPAPRRWVHLHAGLDEAGAFLHAHWPAGGQSFDFFDPQAMTEPSIARARQRGQEGAPSSRRVDFRRLPLAAGSCDAALLLLSAHELRRHEARVALLAQVQRALAPGGKVVLAEHLRDGANFLAFGPGALHFHSAATWRRAIAEAGLRIERRFHITPFITVFILRSES